MALVVIAGCAGSVQHLEREAILPEVDIIQMKESSDEALRMAQEARLDVDALRNRMTEIDNRMVLLSEEVASVSIAKIEEIETRLSLLIEAYKDLHAQVRALENRPVTRASSGSAPASFSPASASELLTSSPEYDLYQNALRAFNGRHYEQALRLFTQHIEKFPQGRWTGNAKYWIGECHYAMGDFASAISSFRRVISDGGSSKADDSQFKVGLSFLKMGHTAEAKEELQILVDRYPASEYVQRARNYLKDLR
ncbi:Tol-pal system protein YbgF [Chitinispirillum alkaliphilum]|nr:Tol-pal system protein YbgF [Chitinispirillum alkaliphilum]